MTQKKNAIDSLFDLAEGVVDSVSPYLKEDEESDSEVVDVEYVEVKVKQQPLLKSEGSMNTKKLPREVTLYIKAVAKRRGGVGILCETETHEMVVINLEERDWKTLCDNADWMRMVKE